ncbi:addiction module toxin, HicA family (plasmid) [Nissabacter sp. SGAir0207]|nr:type II toxin-antitoxin system HicA family toxin [Nissabacter sp. SGAir0207]QCR38806.1 addiction module toxin, HicA family [Nissabacter sp. SGAir0207]
MSSRELMKLLVQHGWVLKRVKGSHHTYTKVGRVDIITVPHPEKDVATGTLRDILKRL